MATNFSPCKGSYVLNQFPSNVMFGMNGSSKGGHHGTAPNCPILPSSGQIRPILPFWRAIWDDFVPYRPSGRSIWDGRPILPFWKGNMGRNRRRGGKHFWSPEGLYGTKSSHIALQKGNMGRFRRRGEVVSNEGLLDLMTVDLVFLD